MQIVIQDIKMESFEVPADLKKKILGVIINKLSSQNVKCKGSITEAGDILFTETDARLSRPFVSSKDNYIKLDPDSVKAKEIKRSYLLTKRTTESQARYVWLEGINRTLDNFGVSCLIYLIKNGESKLIREQTKYIEWPFNDTSFPIEKL